MINVSAFVIRIYKLIVKMISYYLDKLEKKFTIYKCRMCWEDYGQKDTCVLPMSHPRNNRMITCKKCHIRYLGFVYNPCPVCKEPKSDDKQ